MKTSANHVREPLAFAHVLGFKFQITNESRDGDINSHRLASWFQIVPICNQNLFNEVQTLVLLGVEFDPSLCSRVFEPTTDHKRTVSFFVSQKHAGPVAIRERRLGGMDLWKTKTAETAKVRCIRLIAESLLKRTLPITARQTVVNMRDIF